MLFASRYSHLRIPILREKRKPLGTNEYGEVVYETLLPDFTAEFDAIHVLQRDRLTAYHALTGRGWVPTTVGGDGGVVQDVSSPDFGGFYEGDKPEYRIGFFDTEDERFIPAQFAPHRAVIEDTLLELLKDSRDFVLVEPEKLKPPWPNYDKLDGRAPQKALEIAEEGGYDLSKVLAYEAATKNRESWVRLFDQKLTTDALKRAEDAALTVTI